MRVTWGFATATIAVLFIVGGCGSPAPGEALGGSTRSRVVAHVYPGVEFYPACGNEVLDLDGATWYQLLPDEQRGLLQRFEDENSMGATPPSSSEVVPRLVFLSQTDALSLARPAVLPAVSEPGPGDDTGELIVYPDGLARFVSDSGDLTTWLSREGRTYDWVC